MADFCSKGNGSSGSVRVEQFPHYFLRFTALNITMVIDDELERI
jgi:hypothetical protein